MKKLCLIINGILEILKYIFNKTKISSDNINKLKFLDLMTNIDKYSELSINGSKIRLREDIQKYKIDFNKVKKNLPKYPDRIYRNIYEGGLMGELV